MPASVRAQPALLGTWGTQGSGPGEFLNGPAGVTADPGGHVYATDNNPGARVQVFSASGDFLSQWQPSMQFADAGVDAIAADGTGHLLMLTSSQANFGIARYYVRYTTSGSLSFAILVVDAPSNCECNLRAFGIAADPAGDALIPIYGQLLSAYNSVPVGQVNRFHPNTGFAGSWGTPGNGPGQIASPAGIAIGPGGVVYLADATVNRVEEFTADGTFIRQWGSMGSGDGQFQTASAIAVGPSGHVYVTDVVLGRIQEFTADGAFVSQWGSPGTGLGQFQNPVAIAVDADENIYVADALNHRIQKFGTPPVPVVHTSWGRIKSAYR